MSGKVLLGGSGMKVAYQTGFTLPFQDKDPGLSMLVRHACERGWEAVGLGGLKGRGRRPSLFLKTAAERAQGLHGMRGVKPLTGKQFVAWVTQACLNRSQTSRIRGA